MKNRVFIFLVILILFSCATKQIKTVTNIVITQPIAKVEVIPSVSEEDLKQGKATFEGSCNSCHQLYEPKQFNKKEWEEITNRMQKKAHLNDVEISKVYNYIVSKL